MVNRSPEGIDLNEVANTTEQQLNDGELFISGTAWVTMVA